MKSKSYGLGKDILWSLTSHEIVRELGYRPPRQDIHTFKYDHEKSCADIFVSLVPRLYITGWHLHTRVKGIIPDRTAELRDTTLYIENERGTQGPQKLEKKLEAYRNYFYETRETFQVLFVVKDAAETLTNLIARLKLPYYVTRHEDLMNLDTCQIHSYKGVQSFLSVFQTQVKEA